MGCADSNILGLTVVKILYTLSILTDCDIFSQFMESKFQRRTRFGEGQGPTTKYRSEDVDTKRKTKFPTGTELLKLSFQKQDKPSSIVKAEAQNTVQVPRLPLKANLPTSTPSKPPPTRNESPWNTYTHLGLLERGGEVITACTRVVPVKMVAVKRLSSDFSKELATCQHENLLSVLELYKHDGAFFVITDYTVATLKQIIGSSSRPLQELHVSAICQQGRCFPRVTICLSDISQVFKGMQHLSRFGLAHQRLDSSKILFMPESRTAPEKSGLVKIGTFNKVG